MEAKKNVYSVTTQIAVDDIENGSMFYENRITYVVTNDIVQALGEFANKILQVHLLNYGDTDQVIVCDD